MPELKLPFGPGLNCSNVKRIRRWWSRNGSTTPLRMEGFLQHGLVKCSSGCAYMGSCVCCCTGIVFWALATEVVTPLYMQRG